MSLLVTGSIGIDTVKTPYGISENCLGGSAVYFSMAASFFSPVRLIGVVGSDCPFDLAKVFAGRDVDLAGLEVRVQSKTFRWSGTYHKDMDERTTDKLELNVLAEEPPQVPNLFKDSKFVFLANTAPALQHQLLEQIDAGAFVAADTMNCWIDGHLDDLKRLLKKIDCLIINEDEARTMTSESNLVMAAEKILDMGPRIAIIKKGESGSLMCSGEGERFILPAWPAGQVKDPTGASAAEITNRFYVKLEAPVLTCDVFYYIANLDGFFVFNFSKKLQCQMNAVRVDPFDIASFNIRITFELVLQIF